MFHYLDASAFLLLLGGSQAYKIVFVLCNSSSVMYILIGLTV